LRTDSKFRSLAARVVGEIFRGIGVGCCGGG
jgi:hypothetical protein